MSNRKFSFHENSYYHVFNRGVEKRIIFLEKKDYEVFCQILLYYLTFTKRQFIFALQRSGDVNLGLFKGKISLISYSLMPNHFHLLLRQENENVISDFMKRILTTYAMYFNHKYDRVGSLFQGRFKAKLVDTDEYLLQVNKYIHRNALNITRSDLVGYPWSSYAKFINEGDISQELYRAVDSSPILSYFSLKNQSLSYMEFVEMIPQDEIVRAEIISF